MHRLLKISLLSITLIGAGCATRPPNVSLGLGTVTCPASFLTPAASPDPFAAPILSQMSAEAATYVLERESWWETVLANGEQAKIDGLTFCTDINRLVADAEARRTN